MNERASPTRAWSAAELVELDRSPLIRVAATRPDGTLREFVLIGHIRLGEDVIIRSLKGAEGAWYRSALLSGHGELEAGRHRIAVAFLRDLGREEDVDRALRSRYGDDSGVQQMTSSPARDATLHAVPLA